MPTDYITVREFTAWSQSLDKKIDRILDHIEQQEERNLQVEARITTLEVRQTSAHATAMKVSSAIGAIVAVLISGVFAWPSAALGGMARRTTVMPPQESPFKDFEKRVSTAKRLHTIQEEEGARKVSPAPAPTPAYELFSELLMRKMAELKNYLMPA